MKLQLRRAQQEQQGTRACPFCHDRLETGDIVYRCSGCGTIHHRECGEEFNRYCATTGCAQAHRDLPDELESGEYDELSDSEIRRRRIRIELPTRSERVEEVIKEFIADLKARSRRRGGAKELRRAARS